MAAAELALSPLCPIATVYRIIISNPFVVQSETEQAKSGKLQLIGSPNCHWPQVLDFF